jgi:hypothetical protein
MKTAVGIANFCGRICLALCLFVVVVQPAFAVDDPPLRVARLNYVEGDVSFQPGGETDWGWATLNRPMTTGDSLWTGDSSRAEMHIGSTAIRVGGQTSVSFLNLDDRTVQIQLNSGTIDVRVRNLYGADVFEVDTPNLAFTVLQRGDYRITVDPEGSFTTITLRDGQGQITGGGQAFLYGIGSSQSAYSYAPNPNFAFGVAPDGALCSNAACTTIQRIDLFGALPQEPNPYVYSFSGEVQYEFAKNYVFTIGYYGSRSRKLIRTIDLNRIIPGDTFDGNRDFIMSSSANGVACGPGNPLCPAPVQTGNPRFNRIFFPLPDVNASYDSLVTTVRHNFTHGLSFQGSWTYAHSIDTASYEVGFQQTDPSNQLIDKGNSDYNVRHNFVASVVWELPWLRNRRGFLGEALGGWSISSIFDKHTGFPFSALIGCCDPNRDRNGDGYIPDLPFSYTGGMIANPSKQDWMNGVFPFPATSFPGATVIPAAAGTFGPGCRCRNIFTGPGYSTVDLSLAKQFKLPSARVLGEGARLDFRANFYNLFNILNLAPLVPATAQTDITNSGQFGKTPTGLAGRVIEFQARFSF